MKTALFFQAFLFMIISQTSAQTTAEVDTKTSVVNWTGHAEIGSYSPSGTLRFKGGSAGIVDDSILTATLSVDMKSMKQENDHLLEHLKSGDFFDVERFPVSTIEITRVINGEAFGRLTIKGKTRPFHGKVKTDRTGSRFTVSGQTVIDRTDFGIVYNSGSFFSGLGDKAIRNNFDLSFMVSFNIL